MKKILLGTICLCAISGFLIHDTSYVKANSLEYVSEEKISTPTSTNNAQSSTTQTSEEHRETQTSSSEADTQVEDTLEPVRQVKASVVTDSWGTTTWVFDPASGKLSFTTGGMLGETASSPWNRTDAKKIDPTQVKVIAFTQPIEAPVNSSFLFSKEQETNAAPVTLSNCSRFEGIENLSTSRVSSMKGMFYNMNNLEALDVSHFRTDNVTNMNMLFRYCYKLKSMDLSNFVTSNVTNMAQMFDFNQSLEKVTVSSFDTSKVSDMRWMFYKNFALTTLDISNFDMRQKPNMHRMFVEDASLRTFTLGPNFRVNGYTTDLPAITQAGYTGNWKKLDGQTVGTTSEFLTNYDGTNPGTYVWETSVDPLDPSDGNQRSLVLKAVPTAFDFQTELKPKSYRLSQNLTNQAVEIYNDRLARDWSVKASVLNNQLTLENALNEYFPISSFKINQVELTGTGNQGIIVQSVTDKTLFNNVGVMKQPISQASIDFQDENGRLKASNTLKGTINYQLYNTPNAD